MSTRRLAIAGSVAALSLVAVPIAQAASTPHHNPAIQSRVDRSRDPAGSLRAHKARDASRDTKAPTPHGICAADDHAGPRWAAQWLPAASAGAPVPNDDHK
jgi:hypothetical protein